MIELKKHNQGPYKQLCNMLETEQKCAYISATGIRNSE